MGDRSLCLGRPLGTVGVAKTCLMKPVAIDLDQNCPILTDFCGGPGRALEHSYQLRPDTLATVVNRKACLSKVPAARTLSSDARRQGLPRRVGCRPSLVTPGTNACQGALGLDSDLRCPAPRVAKMRGASSLSSDAGHQGLPRCAWLRLGLAMPGTKACQGAPG